MDSQLRFVILTLLLLLLSIKSDFFDVRSGVSGDKATALTQAIEDVLVNAEAELLDTTLLESLSRQSLNTQELANIKSLLDYLQSRSVSAIIKKNNKPIFWTNEASEYSFCTSTEISRFQSTICLSPFDQKGNVPINILQQNKLPYHFSLSTDTNTPKIRDHSVRIGNRFQSKKTQYLILSIFFLGFISLIFLTIKNNYWLNYFFLIAVRLVAHFSNWSGRFSIADTSAVSNYNILDLSLDSLILFALITGLSKLIFDDKKKFTKSLVGLCGGIHILLLLLHMRVAQLIVENRLTPLSIDDIGNITTSDILSFVSLTVILLGIFGYGYGFIRKLKRDGINKNWIYQSHVVAGIIGLSMTYIIDLDTNLIIIALFLLSYLILLDLFADVKTKSITWVIWWGIFFAVYLSAILFNYDYKKKLETQVAQLKGIIQEVPEYKLEELIYNEVSDDIYERVGDLLTIPEGIKYDKKELEFFLNDGVSRKDILLEIYDQQGKSLMNESSLAYKDLAIYKSISDSLYFDEIGNILWFEKNLGLDKKILIGFEGKSYAEDLQFPFNYYKEGRLIFGQQSIPEELIHLSIEGSELIKLEGSEAFLIHKTQDNKILISRKSFPGLIKPIALFSFLFCIITLIILGLGISNLALSFLPQDWPLQVEDIESLNSKIQISLILVILLSFVIIASITNTFLKNYISAQETSSVAEKLDNLHRAFNEKTKFAIAPQEAIEVLSNYRKELETVHNVDLEFHSLLEPNTKKDFFSSLFYKSQNIIAPYSDNKGNNYIPIHTSEQIAGIAHIRVPENKSLSSLSVYDFLGSVFNVYVFLFLIASVLSIFIARSITRPLSMLNQKLKQTKLGKQNEPLKWERDDEIGILIGNYNDMVTQLEESANILAKTERDSAWREMAKQVAHEIKNPLTPMKLSIQYLEKAIKQYPDRADEIAKKISTTILEQIDNLSGIAEAFGNFAALPKSSNAQIELNSIVDVVYNLFKKRDDMDIKFAVPIDPIYVFADKNQLVRILNNLVKNAIESIPEDRPGKIHLSLYTKKDKAIIKIKDNGCGIPDDMKEKIFQPKFTTKDSGSGLGLAIAANMIESMNGKIYFESEAGQSTSFFIELDIIRQQHKKDNQVRIPL